MGCLLSLDIDIHSFDLHLVSIDNMNREDRKLTSHQSEQNESFTSKATDFTNTVRSSTAKLEE